MTSPIYHYVKKWKCITISLKYVTICRLLIRSCFSSILHCSNVIVVFMILYGYEYFAYWKRCWIINEQANDLQLIRFKIILSISSYKLNFQSELFKFTVIFWTDAVLLKVQGHFSAKVCNSCGPIHVFSPPLYTLSVLLPHSFYY